MPTFKIYISKDQKRKDDKYPVSIRVTLDRKHSYLKTDFYVVSQQLNKNFEIKDKTLLKLLLEKIEDCEDIIVRGLGNDVSNYSAKDIVEFIKKKQNEVSCIDFIAFAKKQNCSRQGGKSVQSISRRQLTLLLIFPGRN